MPTIALVDDDRNILTSVSIALESEGYRVQTYTDGASALDGLDAARPDLAILDIKMPRMDGMELLRRLRQKSDLPVIFLTSKDDEIDELFGLKMGADDFIKKPFSQRLLVERVKAVLRRFQPRDATDKKGEEALAARTLDRGALSMDQERHTCTWKGLPVIFLTSKDEEIDELSGLKMGADDFIKTPFSQRLLVERVKSILRRSAPRDGTAPGTTAEPQPGKALIERGNLVMDEERHTCTWKGQRVTLTVTEFLILQALALRPGVVKSRNALMDAAYDDQVYVDDRTIDSHIKRLRKKFKVVDDDFEMIETLYGVGYRFKET